MESGGGPETGVSALLPAAWNALPVPVLLIDSETTICLANNEVEKIVGYSYGDLAGKPVSALDFNKSLFTSLNQSAKDALSSGTSDTRRAILRHKNGRSLTVEVQSRRLQGEDRAIYCLLFISSADASAAVSSSSQEALRVLEQAEVGYFRIGQDGCYENVNRAWLRMHGFTDERQIIGRHFSAVQTPEDLHRAQDLVRNVLRGETVRDGEFSRLRADGSVGYHKYSITPIVENGLAIGLEGFLFDITAQRLAELQMEDTERQYRSLFNCMSEGVAIHRIVYDGDRPDNYILLDVNSRYEEIVGMRKSEVAGKSATEVYRTLEAPYLDVYAKAVRTEASTQFETYFAPTDKQLVVSVAPLGRGLFATIFFDVTSQNRAERQYQEIFEGAVDGIYRVTPEGRSIAANPALVSMLGYDRPEELINRITDAGRQLWMNPPDRRKFIKAVEEHGFVRSHECRFIRKDGTPIWVSVSARKVCDQQGRTIYYEGFVEDISERKKTERELHTALEDLQRNAEVLHVAQRAARFGVFNWDAKTGKSVWSPEAFQLYGLDPDVTDASFDSWLESVHPGDRDRMVREFQASLDSPDGELRIEYRAADGERWIAGIGQLFRDAEGHPDYMIGINIDITQHKRIEQTLELREAEKQALFEALETPIIMLDVNAGSIIYANRAFLALNGIEAKDLSSIHALADWTQDWELLHSDGRPMAIDEWPVSRMLRNEELRGAEMISRNRHNGREFCALWNGAWVRNAAGERFAIALSATDISEFKRVQEALRKSEEKFSRIFRFSPAASTITLRLPDGWQILDVNEAFERMTGYSREEVLQDSRIGTSLWVDPVHLRKALERLLAEGRVQNVEYQFRRKKGDVGTGLISGELIEIDGKLCVLSSTIDITDRIELERQFLQSQKLESVGRLAGGVAHDFNNLLTVINGYSAFLLKDLEHGGSQYLYADEIGKAGERAAGLTRQLLAFSRKQVSEPRQVDLNTIILDSERMLRRLIAEDITLITALDPSLGPIMADPTQIHQVIMNLVVNARDAMPSGGTLTLETRNHTIDETAAAIQMAAKPGEYVVLRVNDSGTGMDDATREHLFEPFFTTKGSEHGSGLGLSTVYGIVRQSGGWIDVRTRLGVGSTFELFFPRIDGAYHSQQWPHNDRLQARAGETVLVVEDQDAVRGLIAAVLKDHGYRVLEAANADGALEIAREDPVELHLLLTDVVLPGMNGRELAEKLRLLRPGIKVLFTSGYTSDVIAHRGVVDFGLAYLPKPFTERALALKVREVLDKL